jgi:hypothetical protein
MSTFTCDICGFPIRENGERFVTCPNCGAVYSNCVGCYGVGDRVGSPDPDVGSLILGAFIGLAFISPFIYIPVLRNWAIETIRRGADVSKRTVEGWLKKGSKHAERERKEAVKEAQEKIEEKTGEQEARAAERKKSIEKWAESR